MNKLGTILLWSGTFLSTGVALASAPRSLRERVPARPAPSWQSELESREVGQSASVDSLWILAPFRASRTVPAEPYTVARADAEAAATAHAAAAEAAARAAADSAAALDAERPNWTLTGTVLGHRPVAVFDGVGDAGAAVLALGEEVEGFTISEIHADVVVVTRGSQAWSFALPSPSG